MAHPGFGHLWQQQELSDVDIVIMAGAEDAAPAGDSVRTDEWQSLVLQQFAGHSTILSISPYCKAQVLRWPSAEPDSSSASGSATTSSSQEARRQIKIMLPDASHEAAAMAVLQSLYLVKPDIALLAELTQQQLLQAVVLADMWGVSAAVTTALELLTAAANSPVGLDKAASEQLLAVTAAPDCLLPLLQQTLLSRYGDLEAVWASKALEEALMNLPMHAMQLLLSLDDLKVASEDTVLFTAQCYADKLEQSELCSSSQQIVQSKLAALVRCPHLSKHWRAASVLSDNAAERLLGGLQTELRRLLMMQTLSHPEADEIKLLLPDAPSSRLLPPRAMSSKQVNSVQVEWAVDVAAVQQAAERTASTQGVVIVGTSPFSQPLMGITWQIRVNCKWDAENVSKQGVIMGVYAMPANLPPGAFVTATLTIECLAPRTFERATDVFIKRAGRGWRNWFDLDPMPGGFDEVAWAAKGLPTSGQLVFKLTVEPEGQ